MCAPGNDEPVGAGTNPMRVARAVEAFFGEHAVASLRLPTGWFGRPYDNWHELSDVTVVGDVVVVRLDELQVLPLHAVTARIDGRTLQVTIHDGYWEWTSYGGTDRHHQQLGAGAVEFHAPFAR
jgi:hypothetical protein